VANLVHSLLLLPRQVPILVHSIFLDEIPAELQGSAIDRRRRGTILHFVTRHKKILVPNMVPVTGGEFGLAAIGGVKVISSWLRRIGPSGLQGGGRQG